LVQQRCKIKLFVPTDQVFRHLFFKKSEIFFILIKHLKNILKHFWQRKFRKPRRFPKLILDNNCLFLHRRKLRYGNYTVVTRPKWTMIHYNGVIIFGFVTIAFQRIKIRLLIGLHNHILIIIKSLF
jgi:hypothetical protein